MTVLATTQRPSRAPSSQRPSYEDLLDYLADAREWIRTLELVAVGVAIEARHPRPCDVRAERRVLGAMVVGRATLRDVAGLERGDFCGDGHAELFAALLRQLRQEQRLGVHVRPSARRDPAMRAYVTAEVRRRAVGNLLVGEGAFVAASVLDGLPWPAASPQRDVVRVEELGRWRRGER